MCRVLPFPPRPDDATRDLLSMVTDDLQILAIHELPTFVTAARLVVARADATRDRLWGTAPRATAPSDELLPRLMLRQLRLLAYDLPQIQALALEVADLAQAARIHLAGMGRRSAAPPHHASY